MNSGIFIDADKKTDRTNYEVQMTGVCADESII